VQSGKTIQYVFILG